MPVVEEVNWSKGRRTAFEEWLSQQITNVEGDRADLVDKWKDDLTRWRSKTPDGSKEWPFAGASNVKFPLTAIHSDPVAADFLQTIHATDEFWNVEPRRSQTIEAANAWREGLRYIDEDFLKMREVNKRAVPLTIVHGTGVYKSHWLHERVPRKDYNAAGEIEKRIVGRSHPVIDHVPLQRFYFPADSWSLRWEDQGGARWVAEKHIFTPNQLRTKAKSEELIQPAWDKNAVDFVVEFTEELAGDNEVDEKLRDQSEFKPHREMKIEVFEVWARFDTDGDGIADNVQIMWHQPTGTILRALHNPFLHGKRPYESVQYLPYPGIYGIGLAEADKWAQKTLTKLINAQVDNVLLANTRMFSAPLGGAIEPGEPIYPGKIWLHGPGEDIEPMQAGEVYPSLPNAIGQFLEISEQRTGVSELRQGNITALPSRTPASTALSVLQEGSKRFNMILGNMREPFGQLGLRVMQNLAQYFREDKVKWARYFRNAMGQEDAQQFLQQLNQPIHDVEDGFSVSLRATGAQSNKEAERQQFLQLISIVAQTYAQILQTVQLIENAPPDSAVRKTATKAYQAGVHMLEQLLERFDLQNVEQITPELRQFQNQRQQALQQARQNGVQFAPLGGPQGADPLAQAQRAIAQGFGIGGL